MSPKSLISSISRLSLEEPQKVAYIYLAENGEEKEKISYRELYMRVSSAAVQLKRNGYSGSTAILLYPQGIEFIVVFLACLKAGVIAIPVPALDASIKERILTRIKNIVKDADTKLILTTPGIRRTLCSGVSDLRRQVSWFSIADEVQSDGYEDISVENSTAIAYLQYTSGSTCLPKGVVIEHEILLKHLEAIQRSCAYDSDSITVSWMPHFHDYGLVEGLLLPLFNGTLCVFMAPSTFIKRPSLWFTTISHYKATHSHAPSFAHELCINKLKGTELHDINLSSWRVAALGAEPIKPNVLVDFFSTFSRYGFLETALTPAYGLAENTLVATIKKPFSKPKTLRVNLEALKNNIVELASNETLSVAKEIVSCGVPIKNTSVLIVDPKTAKRCEELFVGEVWLSSEGVARGYWKNADATNETFKASLATQEDDNRNFLRTGDLGFMYQGELYITGRLKDLIIIDGVNYWPQDIEWAVENSHSEVKRGSGCVAFTALINGKERLIVFSEVKSDALDFSELHRRSAESVFEVCGLTFYDFVVVSKGTILKTSSGKLQRNACKELYSSNEFKPIWSKQTNFKQYKLEKNRVSELIEVSSAQKEIAAWLSNSIMHCTQMITVAPHVNDVLAELPLDSLDYLTLASDIEARYSVKLALSEFVINRRTVANLADHIFNRLQGKGAKKRSLVLLQEKGAGSPFFCVHPAGGNIVGYAALAHSFVGKRPFYGIQSQGLVEGTNTLQTFEEMAEFYIGEIKQVQPRGPYFFGGMCLGGIIAYEMAQQIQRSGETVGFLGLIDPRNPSSLLREVESAAFRSIDEPVLFSTDHLDKVRMLKRDSEKTESPKPPRNIIPSDPLMKKVWDKNAKAREIYEPLVFRGDASFFWADKTKGPLGFQHNPEVCWSTLIDGKFDVHRLGMDHFQMLEKPFVERLSLFLINEIEKADSEIR